MKQYDPFEEEFGEGSEDFMESGTNIRSGIRNRFNRNNFNETRRDWNEVAEERRPLMEEPEPFEDPGLSEPMEIEMTERPIAPEAPEMVEPEVPELFPEINPAEPPPIETDFPIEGMEGLETAEAEALETQLGATETLGEAFGEADVVAGSEIELATLGELGEAGEIAGGVAEAGEAGIAGAELAEAGLAGAGALAGAEGGLALAPETLGLSVAVGAIAGALIGIFAHKHKPKTKYPNPGDVKELDAKTKKQMIDQMNKDNKDGKYDKSIANLQGKGDWYLATTQVKDKDGHYRNALVKRLTPDQLAKAQLTLQHNPKAYKGTDPAILEAMGLNPELSKGGSKDFFADGVSPPNQQQLAKAQQNRDRSLAVITPIATYKKNQKKLDTLSGEDKEIFQKVLEQYAWDNNLNADGTPMTKEQISKKGSRPVVPAGETPESVKKRKDYEDYLEQIENQNQDIRAKNAQAQADYQQKLAEYQQQQADYEKAQAEYAQQEQDYENAVAEYNKSVDEYNAKMKTDIDKYNAEVKKEVIEYNTELGEYNIEEARATGIPIDAPVGQYTSLNIQQVIDDESAKYDPIPEKQVEQQPQAQPQPQPQPQPQAPPPPRRNITEVATPNYIGGTLPDGSIIVSGGVSADGAFRGHSRPAEGGPSQFITIGAGDLDTIKTNA
jgi:hypothetical protein